jgi:DNA-binding XRE family transcriptional regulator
MQDFPVSQGALIRQVRGARTQAAFARTLGVERSCLSRYESEALGAPTAVVNHCLEQLSLAMLAKQGVMSPADEALSHAKATVASLERLRRRNDP